MEPLATGVRVHRPAPTDDEPWLSLSAGTRRVHAESAHGIPYLRGAVVPRTAWRLPTDDEARLLSGVTPAAGETVAIVPIADEIVQLLRAVDIGASATAAGAPIRTPEAERAADRALSQLAPYLVSGEDLVLQGIRTQVGGFATATTHRFDADAPVLIGLHIDRWHEGPYGCREHAQLSINLGTRDRYLVFANLPVTSLVGSYGDPVGGWMSIPRDFAMRRPTYPLVRVRIRPGEAYIAPTENLLHDVSYEGNDGIDFSFTLRGRLRWPA